MQPWRICCAYNVSSEVLSYIIACGYGWWDCDVTSCNHQCADEHANCHSGVLKGVLIELVKVAATSSVGVRCLCLKLLFSDLRMQGVC